MSNEAYIRQHREDDVRRLALTRPPEGVDHRWCLQQIEGWQLARRKLPRWAATEGLWYPVRLSMEQCSGEQTALYKRQQVERLLPPDMRHAMVDLTGGLGVDFSYMTPLFDVADYVEIQPELRRLAEHNMPLLMGMDSEGSEAPGRPELHFADPDAFASAEARYQFIFIDPARRDGVGRKTVGIADCTPNVLSLQNHLLSRTQCLMLKLSPMLDITEALRQLKGVREVHVVSVRGECKELLFVMSPEETDSRPTLCCVNLETDEDVVLCPYPASEAPRAAHAPSFGEGEGRYLYEPNASVLKAGVQDILSERYGVSKLHPQSNLFVGDTLIPHFPGRRFGIVGMSDFSKRGLKALLGDLSKANLTTRNFPTPVAQLRRQLRLAEGGNDYLFATTLSDGRHALIRCRRASYSLGSNLTIV